MTDATETVPRQRITLTLKSGRRVRFEAEGFSTTRNGFKDLVGVTWEKPDRFVHVDWAEIAAMEVRDLPPGEQVTP